MIGCLHRSLRRVSSSEGFGSCFALKNRQEGSFNHYRSNFRSYSRGFNWKNDIKSPVLQTSCLQHPYKNWPELRKDKLTPSVFGSAIGFWPRRRVQLWLEKIGAKQPFSGNLATAWNNIKEQEALKKYELLTENNVVLSKFIVYGDENYKDNWLGCSPDGVFDAVDGVSDDLPSRGGGVLEIKCPYFDGDKQIMYPWARVPLYCIPQTQGLMEILDRDWMDFYCWTINGSSLFRLERNPEYWKLMKIALSDFWWNHVIPGKELYENSKIEKPLSEMKSLKPARSHNDYSTIIDASRVLVKDSKLVFREIHGRLLLKPVRNFFQLKSDRLKTEKFKLGYRKAT